MRKRAWLVVLVVGTACAESSTEPTKAESETFAGTMAMVGGAFYAGSPFDGPKAMACAGGGQRLLDGRAETTPAGNVVTTTWQLTTQHRDCAITVSNTTLITNGVTQSSGRAVIRLPAQGGQMPTILELQARDAGTMTTRVGNESHTCTFDLSQTFNAATNQVRITGTSCGQSVDFVRSVATS